MASPSPFRTIYLTSAACSFLSFRPPPSSHPAVLPVKNKGNMAEGAVPLRCKGRSSDHWCYRRHCLQIAYDRRLYFHNLQRKPGGRRRIPDPEQLQADSPGPADALLRGRADAAVQHLVGDGSVGSVQSILHRVCGRSVVTYIFKNYPAGIYSTRADPGGVL